LADRHGRRRQQQPAHLDGDVIDLDEDDEGGDKNVGGGVEEDGDDENQVFSAVFFLLIFNDNFIYFLYNFSISF
jgi:hypothetical protein